MSRLPFCSLPKASGLWQDARRSVDGKPVNAAVRATKIFGDADVEVVAVSIDGVHCGPHGKVPALALMERRHTCDLKRGSDRGIEQRNTDGVTERGAVFNRRVLEALDQLCSTADLGGGGLQGFVALQDLHDQLLVVALKQRQGRIKRRPRDARAECCGRHGVDAVLPFAQQSGADQRAQRRIWRGGMSGPVTGSA